MLEVVSRIVTKVPIEDRRAIALDANARLQSVNNLITRGVDEEDLAAVLELREIMTEYDFNKPKGHEIVAQPTLYAMIKAYEATEGDIDDMEAIVERANAIHARTRSPSPTTLNASIYKAIEMYNKGGVEALETD